MPVFAHLSARLRGIVCLLAPLLLLAPASATELARVRVNAFPNAKSLPLHAGIANGIFARHGLAIELEFTDNSRNQRDGLAQGRSDIVHSALDNAVAMIDVAHNDVIIVTGGDSGMNEFFVQPHIASFADLRGRILIVDAPDTAYALQAKKILRQHGLTAGTDYTVKAVGGGTLRLKAMAENKDYAAAILNLPFSIQAQEMGLRSLGRTVDMVGPYQANGTFVLRAWAQANGPVLEHYIAAYVEAIRWVRAPENRAAAVAMLVEKLKLAPPVAERTFGLLADPSFGFTPDAKLDLEGFRNMLAMRAEVEGGQPATPDRYLDLGYYERAMRLVGP
jgi:ABC-type nitrate/sulfonate/bicarbonate transport system substrate-binding protein